MIQQIVAPDRIEPELIKIWESLAQENKMRASLFNLIVFTRLSRRTDYFRNIVQKVVEKFPCRSIFITSDSDSSQSYLKTAVAVLFPQSQEGSTACDQIDIGVAGDGHEKVPFLILPHIIPDLPICLLWGEDPSIPNPLFEPLVKLSTRVIFDSEAADDLLAFSKTVLDLKKRTRIDIADLNWARTQGWRDLIASTFDRPEHYPLLKKIEMVKFTYNARETEFFVHSKIQAMYLLSWLADRLKWKCCDASKTLQFQFQHSKAEVHSALWEKLGTGTVISIDFTMKDGHMFECSRIPELYHHVKILISSSSACELPYQYVLGKTATGQSLVSEICRRGTSEHYLEMLAKLSEFL